MAEDQEPTDAEKEAFVRVAREASHSLSQMLGPEVQERLRRQSEALRNAAVSAVSVPLPPYVRSEEAEATRLVRDEIERLTQITAASGDQIAALVGIADKLDKSTGRWVRASQRAATSMIVLTVAIVALTYFLVPPESRLYAAAILTVVIGALGFFAWHDRDRPKR